MNVKSSIETTSIEDYTFREQYNNYQRAGFAVDSSTNEILGDHNSYYKEIEAGKDKYKSKSKNNSKNGKKRKIEYEIDSDDLDDTGGPWAAEKKQDKQRIIIVNNSTQNRYHNDKDEEHKQNVEVDSVPTPAPPPVEAVIPDNVFIVEPDKEDEKWEKKNERKLGNTLPARPTRGSIPNEASTTFHGSSLKDYQGRSWISAHGVKTSQASDECYLPKKCVKKLTGHNKGVQCIEYFPNTGHLLLSGSLDGKCKIWDCNEDFQVKRTYVGHSEGVRAISMRNDGIQFLSSAFDRYVRLWDTETGQAVATFTNRKMAYQCKFHPKENNVFLAPSSDNKIYQWDTRTGKICQEYNHHLQPVNSVTFFDDGAKFLSTSDDKKLLVWEYDIPVPIKYIQEPDMHSIPTMTLHPSGTAIAGQSMNNKIVVYSADEKCKLLKKKNYHGHNNSGYACQIGFSHDGKYLSSGDGHGKLHIWDWKTCKNIRKLQAHDNGPCISAIWHPLHTSRLATCGWDGMIKIWD